jgi:hypothetical protein
MAWRRTDYRRNTSCYLFYEYFSENHNILQLKEINYFHANFNMMTEWGYLSYFSDRLRAGRPRNRSLILTGARIFSLLRSVYTGDATHPGSVSLNRRSFPWGNAAGRNIKLTTLLHLVQRLRLSGATSQLPQVPSCCDVSLSTGNKRNQNRVQDS